MTTVDEPNVIKSLKIQVDNDMLNEPNDFSEESMDDEVEEGEASSGDEDEVEVNVIVGDDKQDNNQKEDNYFSRKKSDPHLVNKAREFDFYRPPAVRSRLGKLSSKNKFAEQKEDMPVVPSPTFNEEPEMDLSPDNRHNDTLIEERAKRFGVHSSNKPPKKDMQELYKSLDLNEYDFHRGGFRADAVHVKGIENLRSSQIFHYFKDYPPQSLEWLNDSSCNIAFKTKEEAAKALIGLSCPIKPSQNIKNNSRSKNRKAGKNKEPNDSLNIKTEKRERKKSKTPERRSNSSSSSSSSSSDSSSDSDDEGGSSSNSSSSDSSSDSNSDSSSDSNSDSSSDSSSDSEDEDKSSEKNEKATATTATPDVEVEEGEEVQINNNNNSIVNNNNEDETHQEMDVDEPVSHPHTPTPDLDGSVLPEDIGVPIPSGRWRLGVPCPNAKAILMRFAHCKDKKVPGLEKPIELYDSYRQRKRRKSHHSAKPDDRRLYKRHKDIKESIRSPRRAVPRGLPPSPPKRPHHEWFDKTNPIDEKGYKDLDDPLGENKNPWGFLAKNWGRKETQDNLDYHELLREHVTGQKRKRSVSVSDDDEDYRPQRQHHRERSKRNRHEYRYDYVDEDDYEDLDEIEEYDTEENQEDVVSWNSRIKLPFMRMYADAEEKKKEKRLTGPKKGIGSRLSRKGPTRPLVGSMRLYGSVRRPSARPPNSKDVDLRNKLRMKMHSK